MRIALVSELASPLAPPESPGASGQIVYVTSLARALADLGHDVTVHARRLSADQPEQVSLSPGVTVRHVPAGPPDRVPRDEMLSHVPAFARSLTERWSDDRPDVVHSHFWMSGLASLASARRLRLPVVHTYHALGVVKRRHQDTQRLSGRTAGDPSTRGRIRVERAIGHDADRVVALSSAEISELLRMGVRRSQVGLVPAGVDTERFSPEGPTEPAPRRPRILTVGRLARRKGYDTLIAALSRVPDAELVIVGGPEEAGLSDDPEYRRLSHMAGRFGVSDRLRFLGRVPHDRMPALIRSATVVACVPWYEQFGMVPLEAMACAVPVVTSSVGGFLDTVVDGATGSHVPPGRPDALAAVLRTLLDDPFRAQGYGIAGADRVRSRYTWDRVARDVTQVYRGVCGERAVIRS